MYATVNNQGILKMPALFLIAKFYFSYLHSVQPTAILAPITNKPVLKGMILELKILRIVLS